MKKQHIITLLVEHEAIYPDGTDGSPEFYDCTNLIEEIIERLATMPITLLSEYVAEVGEEREFWFSKGGKFIAR